jgi:hypothetical protein
MDEPTTQSENNQYLTDLQINWDTFEYEWAQQPTLFMQYAQKHAQAIRLRNKAKEQLDLIRAQLERRIRREPGKYQLEKVTESQIFSCVLEQPEYQEATERLQDAEYNVAILAGAKEAFDHKKEALQSLTKLFTSAFYGRPRVEGGDKTVAAAQQTMLKGHPRMVQLRNAQPPSQSGGE